MTYGRSVSHKGEYPIDSKAHATVPVAFPNYVTTTVRMIIHIFEAWTSIVSTPML